MYNSMAAIMKYLFLINLYWPLLFTIYFYIETIYLYYYIYVFSSLGYLMSLTSKCFKFIEDNLRLYQLTQQEFYNKT